MRGDERTNICRNMEQNKKIRILIFPAEGANAIELHDALSTCVNTEVYGASSVERHGRFIFRNFIGHVPPICDEHFVEVFNHILTKNSIDLVFPTHDTVVRYLAARQEQLAARVLGGDLRTTEICRSKIRTHECFADCDFVPRRVMNPAEATDYPLFAKPDEGQGAVGARRIDCPEELQTIDFDRYLVTEYLPGEEYTVDCLTDAQGALRYVSPRSRERLMAGIAVAGRTQPVTGEIEQMARTINERLHFVGLWYFQIRRDAAGVFRLMEISARCAGTMCLTRARGVNLPLLSVYAALGYDISVHENPYQVRMDRALIGRYEIDYPYDTVYIDFDDTITLNGAVNLNVIRYLYQCRNQHKRIVLLTRHAEVIGETLKRYALSELLFDEIVSVSDAKSKSSFIDPRRAIFIDNAYKERDEVARVCDIPVFDVDGVEFLLDWRY